jgi:PleD family two-component response regulator
MSGQSPMREEQATTKQYKILIVEDDPDTAEMLRAYFEGQGYVVLTAAWGNDAIRLCRDTVPDLVIQDIRLPDIDGYQVVQELRKSTRTSNVPIIFLTDRQARDDKITGLRLGAVAYLTKPFDMQELRLRVRNVLRRSSYTSLVSPVTGLPVWQVTEDWLRQLIGKERWAVIYISVQDVDAFSETYGFVAGDDVLRAVGLIIGHVIDEIGSLDDQVGHVDGSGFVLVTQEARVDEIRERLASRLERAFNYFYPIQDVDAGRVAKPMRVQMGIVTLACGPFDSPRAILDAAYRGCETVAVSHSTRA